MSEVIRPGMQVASPGFTKSDKTKFHCITQARNDGSILYELADEGIGCYRFKCGSIDVHKKVLIACVCVTDPVTL